VVTTPACIVKGDEVYYAGNQFEVSLNVRQWNSDMSKSAPAALWGQRTVKYFVYDRHSKSFAPSKFCAFLPVLSGNPARRGTSMLLSSVMTVENYCTIDQSALKFDGGNAQLHLLHRLGFQAMHLEQFAGKDLFESWLANHSTFVRAHRDGPVILMASS
jgi:hypothetical protein